MTTEAEAGIQMQLGRRLAGHSRGRAVRQVGIRADRRADGQVGERSGGRAGMVAVWKAWRDVAGHEVPCKRTHLAISSSTCTSDGREAAAAVLPSAVSTCTGTYAWNSSTLTRGPHPYSPGVHIPSACEHDAPTSHPARRDSSHFRPILGRFVFCDLLTTLAKKRFSKAASHTTTRVVDNPSHTSHEAMTRAMRQSTSTHPPTHPPSPP